MFRHPDPSLVQETRSFVYLLAVAARGKKTRARAQAASAREASGGRGRAGWPAPRAHQASGRGSALCRAPVSAAGIPATEKSCRPRAGGDDGDGDGGAGGARRASRQAPRDDDAIDPGSTTATGRGCTRRERRTPSVRRRPYTCMPVRYSRHP